MIALAGQFNYVFTVPEDAADLVQEYEVRPRTLHLVGSTQIKHPRVFEHSGECLVGPSPRLQIVDCGLLEGGGATSKFTSIVRPRVLGSRFTLTASGKELAAAPATSFKVHREIAALLRPFDVIYIARTPMASLALTVIRDDRWLLP